MNIINILFTIGAVLVAIWIAGIVLHLLGWLIHIVIFVAIALFIYGFIRRRTSI